MKMDDLIMNQQAITAAGRNEKIAFDMSLKSYGTPPFPHETQQVSTASLLSGYYVSAVYIDDKCTTVVSATAYELNSCISYGKYFLKNAATADAESETKYSDLSCTAKDSLSEYIDYTSTCAKMSQNQSTLALVNSNGVFPSSLNMASIRLARMIRLSCIMASPIHTLCHSSK